jgi:MinD-like ATPase involved in chromosome partitioning or flagellar assembly
LEPPARPADRRTRSVDLAPRSGWTSLEQPSPSAEPGGAVRRAGRATPSAAVGTEVDESGRPVEPVVGPERPATLHPGAPHPAALEPTGPATAAPALPAPATQPPALQPPATQPPTPAAQEPASTRAPVTTREPTPTRAPVTTQAPVATPAPVTKVPALPELEPRRRLTADAIRHEQIVSPDREVPRIGWRKAVYAVTGGRVNPGIGAAERDWLQLLDRVRRPMAGARQIAVTSIKGGVGKTTVAACLGLMLAEYRGDGVVAVDADPDAGTLADRLSGAASVTVRDLLASLDKIKSLSQLGEYTTLAGRLRVLAGEQDPAMGEAFRCEEYQRVCRALARFFDIVITDSGTGLVHSAMRGTLELADRLIVVGSPTVDGASRASKTLDWLLAHGHERLAEEAVLVLCQDRASDRVDRAQLYQHFSERCKDVVEIPADPHLYSGGLIDPSLLQPATREAYLRLAAVVADGFSARGSLAPIGR